MKRLPILSFIIYFFFSLFFLISASNSFAAGPGESCTIAANCDPNTTNSICAPIRPGDPSKICGFKQGGPTQNPPPANNPRPNCTIKNMTTQCTRNEDCCVPETSGMCTGLGGGGSTGQLWCGPPKTSCTIKDTTTPCQNDSQCCPLPDTNGACGTNGRCGKYEPPKCTITEPNKTCRNDSDCCENEEILAHCMPNLLGQRTCQTRASAGGTPKPTLPPPPSPPCAKWENGKCASLISAFGDLKTDPEGFVSTLFGVLLSASGGIALLLIMRAGYQLITSEGKPEQIQAGRDQLIAAIVGLLFLIFSLVLLQVIGYDILRIPGFGEGATGGGGTGGVRPQ